MIDLTNITTFISSGVNAHWPILGVRHSSCLGKKNNNNKVYEMYPEYVDFATML